MFTAKWKVAVVLCAVFVMGIGVGAGLLEWRNISRPGHERNSANSGPTAETHALEGEVFLQLENGDVKHAPACTVYIFNSFSPRGEEWEKIMVAFSKSASQGKLSHKELIDVLQFAPGHLYGEKLLPPTKSVSAPFQDREFTTDCDSAGKFKLNIPAGYYIVVATGRAGFNEAVWVKSISIPDERSVTLGDPVYSYLDRPQ